MGDKCVWMEALNPWRTWLNQGQQKTDTLEIYFQKQMFGQSNIHLQVHPHSAFQLKETDASITVASIGKDGYLHLEKSLIEK